MQDNLEAMKAAFLAKGGKVQQLGTAPAYGVDPRLDRLRAMERRRAEYSELRSEIDVQRVREERGYFGR